jgi:mannose-6-phosphate isomerase
MLWNPYPLRTAPFFRDYLWGGRNLATKLGKALPAEGIWAESWEIIDHPEHQSRITNGPCRGMTLAQITEIADQWLLGDSCPTRSLPLLLKYLDCQRVLSVQVHPDDAYAQQMSPPDLGKTEAWYVIHAEPDALLYAGLKEGISREALEQATQAGRVEECLHVLHPQAGDCVFIPAGTVHALGAGLLIAEIQQASNTTFRLFDWNRVDASGEPRALHVRESLEVIDFDRGPRKFQVPLETDQPGRVRLVDCDKFRFDRLSQIDKIEIAGDGKFHFLTAPHGGVSLKAESGETTELTVGQSVILPAAMGPTMAKLTDSAVLLDMFLP